MKYMPSSVCRKVCIPYVVGLRDGVQDLHRYTDEDGIAIDLSEATKGKKHLLRIRRFGSGCHEYARFSDNNFCEAFRIPGIRLHEFKGVKR
jgi:hypothetical protein